MLIDAHLKEQDKNLSASEGEYVDLVFQYVYLFKFKS